MKAIYLKNVYKKNQNKKKMGSLPWAQRKMRKRIIIAFDDGLLNAVSLFKCCVIAAAVCTFFICNITKIMSAFTQSIFQFIAI